MGETDLHIVVDPGKLVPIQEHLHNFFVVNHVLVFKFWRTFFYWHYFLWRLKKCACEKAVYSYFFLDLKYVDNHKLLW